MFHQFLTARRVVKVPGFQRIYSHMKPFFQVFEIQSAHIECFIANDLRRHKTVDFVF